MNQKNCPGKAISLRAPVTAKVLSLPEPWHGFEGCVCMLFILFRFFVCLFHFSLKGEMLFSILMSFGLSKEEMNVSRSCGPSVMDRVDSSIFSAWVRENP